jgi:hypothetical protein
MTDEERASHWARHICIGLGDHENEEWIMLDLLSLIKQVRDEAAETKPPPIVNASDEEIESLGFRRVSDGVWARGVKPPEG